MTSVADLNLLSKGFLKLACLTMCFYVLFLPSSLCFWRSIESLSDWLSVLWTNPMFIVGKCLTLVGLEPSVGSLLILLGLLNSGGPCEVVDKSNLSDILVILAFGLLSLLKCVGLASREAINCVSIFVFLSSKSYFSCNYSYWTKRLKLSER